MAPLEIAAVPDDASTGPQFSLIKQQIELDISFAPCRIVGRTTIDLQPNNAQLREVVLDCRQLRPTSIRIEGEQAHYSYSNLHKHLTSFPGTGLGQYHFIKKRIEQHIYYGESELAIFIPDKVKIKEVNAADVGMTDDAQGPFYAPLKLEIEYVLDDFRDGFQFVGVEDGDPRYPHAYTRNSPFPGSACCLFPCIDDGVTRCPFEIEIRYPRTLGDAMSKASAQLAITQTHTNGVEKADSVMLDADDNQVDLSEEEKAIEMQVICSGTLTDDILDPADPSRKTASFACDTLVLPQHIGFVIGPFEHVDLSEYRDLVDDERLGENAIKVHAFCLPGKEEEVRNSAMMLARTLDMFTEKFQSYAFGNAYKLAFVDDLECDTTHTASFSICSSRLLFPETVWEPLEHTTRVLVHAVASQWIGVDVIAQNLEDYWIIVGGSWFLAEIYLKDLFGRNDWRFRQKLMVDKLTLMDRKRPSLQRLGEYLQADPAEQEFMETKSLMVLSILHNRLVKQSGKNGVDRCLYRMLFNARQGKYDNGAITTEDFMDICEKVGHQKLESFFNQWIAGSGYPIFECFPSFNKKKQVVQLQIKQEQTEPTITQVQAPLSADDFMREAKEKVRDFRSATDYPTFVGPMTIRIHEADGTPYEHIVDINSNNVKVEIPYNTKYKRLKRNRLNKERMAAAQGIDASGEAQEDVTFYMLGDLFTTPEEHNKWRLDDWPEEDVVRQEGEAYEWIRVDADFEWLGRIRINDMPSYMYVSQLQQDKDVVAQAESLAYLASKEGHKLISTFLIKTLMDSRYFHGIRTMAAEIMAQSALKRTDWIGLFHLKKAFQELFCLPGSPMTRSNDFSDRSSYLIQCAVPRAIAKIKGEDGKAPLEAKRFLLDLVRYNDNRGNDYSDDHYIATLMRCLAECLTTSKSSTDFDVSSEDWAEEKDFTEKAIGELTRHQRLDEWIPTYQNVYTTTALECGMKLAMSGVTPFRPTEFLQYAQLGNADNVRLKAWYCLIRLGMVRKDSVLRFLVHEIRSDPSPYFRKQLMRFFGLAFGQMATGDVWQPETSTDSSADMLVVQTDPNSTERATAIARQNLNGALRALKNDLQSNQTLPLVIEEALKSKTLSVSDMLEFLDFCDMVFDHRKKNTLPVKLRWPRYWKVEHLGKGELRFSHTEKLRMKASRSMQPVVAQPVPEPAPAILIKPVEPPAEVTPVLPPKPPAPLPKLSLKIGGIKSKPSAASPPLPASTATPKPRSQSAILPPTIHHSPSPIAVSARASPAPAAVDVRTETRSSTPDVPLMQPAKIASSKLAAPAPVVKTPVPLPAPPTTASAPATARPSPAPIALPKAVATPATIPSPIPATAPKLKIRTKTANGTPAPPSRPPSAAPSPRPSVAPPSSKLGPPPTSATASTPAKPAKSKRKKIVKLRLAPAVLARFKSESSKKRKLQVPGADDERPLKRQSLEPNGTSKSTNVQNRFIKVEKVGGDRPKLLVKIRAAKGVLPVEGKVKVENSTSTGP
ncbi:Transcription initiation factor TFIID subunit 2 [Coniothyrium glycines]